ncbi:MAG: penicillin acylase family protein [Bdellovibrionia bacterium]
MKHKKIRITCLSKLSLFGFGVCLLLLAFQINSSADPLAPPYSNPLEESLKGKPCEIWDDEQGIPHIHALDERVGTACLGYIHARDRGWQMDFFKKTVQGRKAEFFGKGNIRSDFFLRLLGLQEKANSLFQEMSKEDQDVFWAYSWGVNRGMKEAVSKGVYEFQKFNYSPDTWRPQDTIAISLLQSFDQTRRTFLTQLDDFERSKIFGNQTLDLFDPIGLPWDASILKTEDLSNPTIKPSSTLPSATASSPAPFTIAEKYTGGKMDLSSLDSILGGPDMGSNSWVVSPKYSKSGKAWLANDPHLRLTRPTFWHWVHLDAGKIDAIGASFPGVPFIFSGANRHVSWGLTNSFLPAAKVTFVAEKELEQAKTFRPLIWVKVWKFKIPFFFKSFQRTATQLPVLPIPNIPSGKAVVLRWTGFDLKAKDFAGLLGFMRSQNVREMDNYLAQTGVPSWNFNFADDQGSIGYRAIGRIFRPTKGNAFSVLDKTLAEVENNPEFSQPLTREEMPHVLNPDRGFVVTANNTHWPAGAPLSSGRAPKSAFRAFRIEELLKASPQHDLESNQKIQCDVQAVDARFILPKLLTTLAIVAPSGLSEKETSAIGLLKAWNFETDVNCVACGIFRSWVGTLYSTQKLDSASLYRMLNGNTTSEWKSKLVSTFQESIAQLTNKGKREFPKWGELHLNYFRHLADPEYAKVPPLGTPGDENTVNPGSGFTDENPFEHTDGASQRLLVEMTSPPTVYSILPGMNADLPVKDFSDPSSPWQDWAGCRMKKRNFPVDWSKLTSQTHLVL